MVQSGGRYELAKVRFFCQSIYQRPLSPQTFSNWKAICGIEKGSHWVDENQAILLVRYAELRRDHGYYMKINGQSVKIDRLVLLNEAKRCRASAKWLKEIFEKLNQPELPTIYRPQPTLGRKLPRLIKQTKGKSVSVRTMYRVFMRIGRRFDLNRTYTADVVQVVLDYFDRPNQSTIKESNRNAA